MIKLDVTVEYMVRKSDNKIFLNLDDMYAGQNDDVDWWDRKQRYHTFTNKGKVSKPERSSYEILNLEAEKQFQKIMKLKQSLASDQVEANRLAELLRNNITDTPEIWWNSAEHDRWFDDDKDTPGWVTIKEKESNSRWYENAGELNSRSVYLYQVPAEYKEIALKLQAIRRKYQNVKGFNFISCSYPTRIVRVADHPNW